MVKVSEENERGEKRKREEEKEERETERVKRRCDGFVSVEAFEIFSRGRDLESCGGLYWRDFVEKPEHLSDCEPDTRVHVRVVLDLMCLFPLLLWSLSYVIVSPVARSWNLWNRSLFPFSKKRVHTCTVTQEEMRFEGPQVKALPLSSRRMMPPTPLQNSYSSLEEEQGHFEEEDQIWSARDITVIAKTKQYLEESLKVEIEELESLLGPDDTEVDFRRILEEARDEKGCAIFETFTTDGPSEYLVVSRSRWDKHKRRLNAPWRQNSSASSSEREWQEGLEEQRVGWSPLERKVMGAVEAYLEKRVNTKVDIEALERLMEPENEEVSLEAHP